MTGLNEPIAADIAFVSTESLVSLDFLRHTYYVMKKWIFLCSRPAYFQPLQALRIDLSPLTPTLSLMSTRINVIVLYLTYPLLSADNYIKLSSHHWRIQEGNSDTPHGLISFIFMKFFAKILPNNFFFLS